MELEVHKEQKQKLNGAIQSTLINLPFFAPETLLLILLQLSQLDKVVFNIFEITYVHKYFFGN